MSEIQRQIDQYASSLAEFCDTHQLPKEWFEVADHVAFKAANTADFECLIDEFKPLSAEISCITMDSRRLATARLSGGLTVGRFGAVSWVELMEPRPEKVGNDVVGMEHMEFLFPDFDHVKAVLDAARVPYELQQNPGHSWVNVVINGSGQELKLNDQLLADVVVEELKDGRSKVLYP